MTSGGQCVMMTGAVLTLVLSASSWDMQPLEVSTNTVQCDQECLEFDVVVFCNKVEFHIAMLSLVLVLVPSTWMMLLVLQVLVSYWNVLAGQS